jgi:hypothetical protein
MKPENGITREIQFTKGSGFRPGRPWIDEALAMYGRGDSEKVDLCGIELLRLLKKLRVVSLWDATVLMNDYYHFD